MPTSPSIMKALVFDQYGAPDVPGALRRFGEARHVGKVVITVPGA